jgi:hypothetical protein
MESRQDRQIFGCATIYLTRAIKPAKGYGAEHELAGSLNGWLVRLFRLCGVGWQVMCDDAVDDLASLRAARSAPPESNRNADKLFVTGKAVVA